MLALYFGKEGGKSVSLFLRFARSSFW